MHYFVLCVHHLIFDYWSLAVFERDLRQYYLDYIHNENKTLPQETQEKYDRFYLKQSIGSNLKQQIDRYAFWEKRLANPPAPCFLPYDRKPISGNPLKNGAGVSFCLAPDSVMELQETALKLDSTVFSLLLSSFFLFLRKYTLQNDLLLLMPITLRKSTDMEREIGCFMDTIPLRIRINDEWNGNELIYHVRQLILEAYSYQGIEYREILNRMYSKKGKHQTPNVLFHFLHENEVQDGINIPDVTAHQINLGNVDPKFEFSVDMLMHKSDITGHISYSSDHFNRTTIQEMADDYCCMMSELIRNRFCRLSDMPFKYKENNTSYMDYFDSVIFDFR